MKISIVTPSFRQSEWLKLCIASVADQEGVEVEHIVQDSVSDDGTADWLAKDPRVTAVIEKDTGMYDAVNRGFRKATGEILAYLNCDEQYLPGTLKAVHDYFEAHPEMDILVADTVYVDPEGNYLFHRCSEPPEYPDVWIRFSSTTCSLFLRRRVLEKHDLYFDTRWRDLGDAFWYIEAARKKLRIGSLRLLASAFTLTGSNMNSLPNAQREKELKNRMTPKWVEWLRPYYILKNRIKVDLAARAWKSPYDYAIYTKTNPDKRTVFHVDQPTNRWKNVEASN